jgi:hypothetical protein
MPSSRLGASLTKNDANKTTIAGTTSQYDIMFIQGRHMRRDRRGDRVTAEPPDRIVVNTKIASAVHGDPAR